MRKRVARISILILLFGVFIWRPAHSTTEQVSRKVTEAIITSVSLTDSEGGKRKRELGKIVELKNENHKVLFWYFVLPKLTGSHPPINHPQSEKFVEDFSKYLKKAPNLSMKTPFSFMLENTTTSGLKNYIPDITIDEPDESNEENISLLAFYNVIKERPLIPKIYVAVKGEEYDKTNSQNTPLYEVYENIVKINYFLI